MWKSNFNVEIHKAQAYGNLRLPLPLTRRYLIVGRCQWLCLLKKLSSCGGGRDLSELEERGSWAWRRKNWFFGFLSVWVGEGTVAPGVALQTAYGPCTAGLWWDLPGSPRGQGPSLETLALTAWALPPRSCQVCSEFNKTPVICTHVHIGGVLLRGRG